MNLLEQARTEIDNIDKQMAELFELRMSAVEKVITYKKDNNMPITDNNREQIVIQKNTEYINNDKYKCYYQTFITHLMKLSKQYQKQLLNTEIVGYQGIQGAFSHIASMHLFKDSQLQSFSAFEDIFKAVQNSELAYGVLPFENSYTGEVGEVMDLLYKYDCHINTIYDLKINQNLLGLPNTRINDIKQVYSHNQALSQSKEFLERFNFELIPYANTALAAQYISQTGDITKAAVASAETAKLYGLDVLAPNINTSTENTTRFIVISKNLKKEGNRFNLLFTVHHNTGELAKVLKIISDFGFNMESVKSKSLHSIPWQYYFYVEIVGDVNCDNAKELMKSLEDNCKELKLLGTYFK